MRTLDPFSPDAVVRLEGVLDAVPTKHGARLRRLPAWTRQQLLDPAAEFSATVTSGVRLSIVTDSPAIEVEGLLVRLQLGEQEVAPGVFDLTVDGDLIASQAFDAGHVFHIDGRTLAATLRRGEPITVRFDGLAPGRKRIEVWLPNTASFELRGVRVEEGAVVEPAPAPARRWVHYGSSISQCQEAARPTNVWPVVAARRAGVSVQSLGFAGQCQLDQYVARTIRDLDADVISLKLGINVVNGDTMRERVFLSAVQGFLDTVRDGHPTTPLAVVTPIICPVAEDHPGPTLSVPGGPVWVVDRPVELATGALSLQRIRSLLTDVVEARRRAGDHAIHLLDGLALFGPDDLADLPDGLHPNDAGYVRMGERFSELAFAPGGAFGA